jgi:glycosyltransferase involved in cell wall biosynthesis
MSRNGEKDNGVGSLNGSNLPTIAIIIPCHNHATFVGKAIKSAVNQDYPRKFIAVLDDGSTDGSMMTINNMMETNNYDEKTGISAGVIEGVPMLTVQNPQGTGPSAARNKLIQMCYEQADLFAMVDADDELLPRKLSKAVVKYAEDPEIIGLIYTDHLIYHEDKDKWIYEAKQPYDRFVLQQENTMSNGPIISKAALDRVGLYDETLRTCEDWDLYLRITEEFCAVHIPEPLHLYRVTGENTTFTVDEQMWKRNWQTVQMKMRQRNAW